jgi:hypothetical protein
MFTVALPGISEKVSYPLEELWQSHICEKLDREVFAVCGQSYPFGTCDRAVLAKTCKNCPGRRSHDCWCCHCTVNSVTWAEGVGKGWKWQESKGGAVATRQGTRVDGNSPPWARNWPSK